MEAVPVRIQTQWCLRANIPEQTSGRADFKHSNSFSVYCANF